MRPHCLWVASTRFFNSSLREMLAGTEIARPAPYLALIASATCWQGSALRDEITTLAPCSARRSAIALPMPREDPVMTATLPSRENKDISVSWRRTGRRQTRFSERRRYSLAVSLCSGAADASAANIPEFLKGENGHFLWG